MIKVVLVDDQVQLTKEIKSVLETDENIQVVGVATDGFEALTVMQDKEVDVVLMDIRMPNMNGVVATQRIKAMYPEVKVVILTTFDDSDYILNAINNGANGYLLKDMGAAAIIDAVKNVCKGDTILPVKVAKRIVDAAITVENDREIKLKRAFAFSDREVEIAMMMFEGFTNRQISVALKLGEGTTRNYISAIYEKTGSENRADAVKAIKAAL